MSCVGSSTTGGLSAGFGAIPVVCGAGVAAATGADGAACAGLVSMGLLSGSLGAACFADDGAVPVVAGVRLAVFGAALGAGLRGAGVTAAGGGLGGLYARSMSSSVMEA